MLFRSASGFRAPDVVRTLRYRKAFFGQPHSAHTQAVMRGPSAWTVGERELFVPFKEFPWFREASVRELTNVQLPSPHHLYWPDLDIDLAVESIEHPEKYPLVSKAQPNKRLQPTAASARAKKPASRRRG